MRRVNIKYFAATIVLILVFILGVGCEYLPSFSFSTSTSTTTPATTPPPINSTYTLTTTTPTKPPSTTSLSLPDIAAVVAKVKPSVVAITSQITSIFGTQNAEGSGWIIDSNGLIVTNNHVVEGAKTVTATLEGGQIYTAKSIRTDPINDLAVIDIGINNLPAATVGDSSELRVGDWVVAIGNALGQGIRATQGIISATGITITVDTGTTLYNLLETTAAINPGNSGGPLVNMRGEVVGITSAKLSAVGIEGMGYAISSNTAKPIIEQLIQQG
jgi:serine protease Do